MSRALSVLLDLLFPPKCVFCGKLLRSGEREVCAACGRDLPWQVCTVHIDGTVTKN